MRLWLVRFSDGTYSASDFDARTGKLHTYRTDNEHRAGTRRVMVECEADAERLGGAAVPFDYEKGVMTEVVSARRAKEIWNARGLMGEWSKGSYTEAEDRYIRKVWDKMNGAHSWAHALLSIMQSVDL